MVGPAVQALIEARVQSELYELLLRWIEALPPRTAGRPANPEVVASVVSWAIFGAGLQWSRNGTSRPAEEIAGQVLKVIVEGMDGSVSLPPSGCSQATSRTYLTSRPGQSPQGGILKAKPLKRAQAC